MKTLRKNMPVGILLTLIAAICIAVPVAIACMGTPPPPKCYRSIYLAKFVPSTVVVHSLSAPITVPIGIGPFLLWEKDKRCPQPVTAELSLTLTCTSAAGGAPVVIGPLTFQLPKPKNPGIQQVPFQNFVIPANTLLGPLPYTCKVVGTFTVTFAGGSVPQGGDPLSATGDTAVCLVPPSDFDPRLPRLDVAYVPTDPKGQEFFKTCRRGDQAIMWFRVSNNDSTEDVTLDISSLGRQTAGLPDGFDPNNPQAARDGFVYAISNPVPGTDVFMAEFSDQLDPDQILPETDPMAVDPLKITRNNVVIPPLETRFFPVSVRSHGMCADGSCNERSFDVTGFFGDPGDNDPAAGCASTLLVVGGAPPKSPLVEINDLIKCGPRIDSQWSQTDYYTPGAVLIDHGSTHAVGNLRDFPGNTQLTGAPLAKKFQTFPEQFPSKAEDSVRTEQEVGFAAFTVVAFPEQADFTPITNSVNVAGLNQVRRGQKVGVPLIVPSPLPSAPTSLSITYNAATDQLTISGGGSFSGTLKDLKKRPANGLRVDGSTCRVFTCTGNLDQPVIGVEPLGSSHASDRPGCISHLEVYLNNFDNRFSTPPDGGGLWRAIPKPINGHAVFGGTKGPLKQPISVIDTFRGGLGGTDNASVVHVTVPGAVNSPFPVPVHTRILPDVNIFDGACRFRVNTSTGGFTLDDPGNISGGGTGKVRRKGDIITGSGRAPVLPGGNFQVDSFFDVFYEINVGNGSGMVEIKPPGGAPAFMISDSNAFDTLP